MDLLWDKKVKIGGQSKNLNSNIGQNCSLLNKANNQPGTKREIQLLNGRLNKLFPSITVKQDK